MNIGIYIYDQAEVLDFSGPFEVFSTASRVCSGGRPFEVFLIAEEPDAVTARAGYCVRPEFSIQNHPALDVLVVAGGDHTEEMHKLPVSNWVRDQAAKIELLASVCTGAFILAAADLLDGKKVTTHWEDIDDLRRQFPTLDVLENVRWVEQGNLFTSAGISAGIDLCLYLVSRLHSSELAEQTARQMDYRWVKNPDT